MSKIFDMEACVQDWSFRERSALWMLALFVLVTGWYLVEMAPWAWTLANVPGPLKPVSFVTLTLVVGSIIIQSVLGARSPDEAQAPADERERPLIDRAGNWAGVVLGVGAVASLIHYVQHESGSLLFHCLVLALLLSAIAENGFELLLLRRGR